MNTEACSKRVFSGPQDMDGHRCTRKAIVEHQGRQYCRLHHPDAALARQSASHAKWLNTLAADQKRAAIARVRDQIATAAIAYVEDCNLKFEEELREAVAKVRSIELKNEK